MEKKRVSSKKDIVVLLHQPGERGNHCFVVQDLADVLAAGNPLKVHHASATWSFDGLSYPVGHYKDSLGSTMSEKLLNLWGIVGVYDRRDTRHLLMMVNLVSLIKGAE